MSAAASGGDEELGDVTADVLCLGAPDEVELGAVGPQHATVGVHEAQADARAIEELPQVFVCLGRSHLALAVHQLRRAARLLTTVTNSEGCTGFAKCSWNPARSARRRSSVRA